MRPLAPNRRRPAIAASRRARDLVANVAISLTLFLIVAWAVLTFGPAAGL